MFHVCNNQSSDIPITEQRSIQLFRLSISYVWNGRLIYLKVRTIGVWDIYENKNERENRKIFYEGQIEKPNLGGKIQRAIGYIQRNDQPHSQVVVAQEPNNTKEEYLQLHFIKFLQSERIPVFEASLRRSNVVVQMS